MSAVVAGAAATAFSSKEANFSTNKQIKHTAAEPKTTSSSSSRVYVCTIFHIFSMCAKMQDAIKAHFFVRTTIFAIFIYTRRVNVYRHFTECAHASNTKTNPHQPHNKANTEEKRRKARRTNVFAFPWVELWCLWNNNIFHWISFCVAFCGLLPANGVADSVFMIANDFISGGDEFGFLCTGRTEACLLCDVASCSCRVQPQAVQCYTSATELCQPHNHHNRW